MADTRDSKSLDRKVMRVRLSPRALNKKSLASVRLFLFTCLWRESNGKGVGETGCFPASESTENRGFSENLPRQILFDSRPGHCFAKSSECKHLFLHQIF